MSTQREIKHSGKVFRDPIHSLIRVDRDDAVILELIDSPEFQRLRRVRQLGVSALTFHGAEHSRLVHSLGVFNFAQRIIDALCRRYRGRDVEVRLRSRSRSIKIAALLHDVGHAPFSHVFERAFGKHGQHEKMSMRLVSSPEFSLASRIQAGGVDPAEVQRLIDPDARGCLEKDVLSSQLDADRMDYLLRDSHLTGVQYGVFDPEWLLNAMCVGLDGRPLDGQEQPWRLCLDQARGREAAQQFILARSHMNDQVYFHRATRGFEILLLRLMRTAAEVSKQQSLPDRTPEPVSEYVRAEGVVSPTAWLALDESTLQAAFQLWAQDTSSTLGRLARAFLFRERIMDSVSVSKKHLTRCGKLTGDLVSENLRSDEDWFMDNFDWTQYKGVRYHAAKPNDIEEKSIESILLTSGRSTDQATPIEADDSLMAFLEQDQHTVYRIYFERSRVEAFDRIFRKYGLVPHSKQGGNQ